MGMLVVIDGLDGSGKQTQTEKLCEHLLANKIPTKRLSFPTYTRSSALIELYLNGLLGSLDDVNVYAASTFFAVDRYASYVQDWRTPHSADTVILTDRYVTANLIHQMGKLPQDRWDDYMDWLDDLEHRRFGLPRPDIVFYLELPVDYAQSLIQARGTKPDLHETNRTYLEQCKHAAMTAAQRYNWVTVSCVKENKLRSIEDINMELWSILTERMG